MSNITPRLMAYLKSWYGTSTQNQRNAGVVVELSFDEFLSLFEARQIASLEKAIERDRLRYQQNEKNKFAYVLTWKSYAACSTGILSINTAIVCSRMKSAKLCLPKKGDKLRGSHKANLSKAKTGVAQTEEHRKAISDGTKGVKKAPWSEERKAARSTQRQAHEAIKRAQAVAELSILP